MRLKEGVGPLISINNGNLNHLHNNTNNSNLNDQHHHNLNEQITTILKNTNDTLDSVVNNTQWSYSDICTNNTITRTNNRIQQNYNNRKDLLQNINNNLASTEHQSVIETTTNQTTLLNHLQQRNNITTVAAANSNHSTTVLHRPPRRNITSSSLCSAESSPDDSLLEYEEPQQSCSSVDTSPHGDEEDRGFELSDSESLSDDGNLSGALDENHHHCHRRGIVNPNYPGFQHLAHTLDYSIKTTHTSDTDFTDDDLDLDPSPLPPPLIQQPPTSLILNNINNNTNNNNNNNNNNEVGGVEDEDEFKIDSVNRLDSVENISKVFYDKPKFNLPLEDCDVTTNTEELNIKNQNDDSACAVLKQDNQSLLIQIVGSNDELLIENELNIKNDENACADICVISPSISVVKENNQFENSSSSSIQEEFQSIIKDLEIIIDEQICADTVVPLTLPDCKDKLNIKSDVTHAGVESIINDDKQVLIEKTIDGDFQPIQESIGVKLCIKKDNACVHTSASSSSIKNDSFISNSISIDDIIGDFGKELEQELDRRIELNQIEKAIVKLAISPDKDKEPAAFKYIIEPNVNEPFKTVTVHETKPKTPTKIEKVDTMMATAPIMEQKINILTPLMFHHHPPIDNIKSKMADAFLSDTRDDIVTYEKPFETSNTVVDSNRVTENNKIKKTIFVEKKVSPIEKFCKEDLTKNEKEKDELEENVVPRKKEKMEINHHTVVRRELSGRNRNDLIANRRSAPASTTLRPSNSSIGAATDKKRTSPDIFGGFDVYNIETAMPHIDLDAIETHLRAAREEERRRRTDREEIRRRLAMGSESDDYYTPGDRPGRKPSLQARLQSGMNLQICFMNETVSDSDSPNSDNESTTITTPAVPNNNSKQISRAPPYHKPASINNTRTARQKTQVNGQRPLSLPISQPSPQKPLSEAVTEADFFARQARLQIEARMALAQAKEMAHMQMEVERQKQKKSPITEMVRSSLEKVGIQFPEERRRVSRQILTEMNVAQLQVIVNDLHTQIEGLNEGLVRFLMERDDLHMEQDSMLVDIEDLTRYLGAKEQSVKEQKLITTPQVVNNNLPPPSPLMAISSSMKPRLHRIASLVKK